MLLSNSASMEPLVLTAVVSNCSPVAEQRSRRATHTAPAGLASGLATHFFIQLVLMLWCGDERGRHPMFLSIIRKSTSCSAEMPAVLNLSLLLDG
ncbi:hypothetical protein CCR75_004499 [Bremia lactucae]|uniref:Uncharacterized protein n=1 Tax=Bremia lactucae TaxID=4779 RepID=A0A976FKL9_BRELC|nr:hypothetical protein CCR75_004499 [Bremia lactucae]